MSDKSQETLLDELLQLETEKERRAYLDRVCQGEGDLRQRLEDLLSQCQQAGQFFQEAGLEGETENSEAESVSLGQASNQVAEGAVIGRYKILEKIGEGGMGDVYMAEQLEPVTRKVALKIIKLGMDTKQVVARFEAERQALAMMDHPNIAKVLDGGATDSGRPYFVMELVRGLSLTEYCEKKKAGIEERLRLFVLVCQAVQSAHQKGVIHRDLKPSNILVTLNHGEPVPKVIDFGIAKATNQRLIEKTLFTKFSQMIGTPAYMSPEQAEMTSLDVDTRTDVYSLGVLLYELLTGTAPFSQEKLLSLGYHEMQRVILEEEPDKPSTRITKTGSGGRLTLKEGDEAGGGSGIGCLNEEQRMLAGSLRGDLDWITMKALEKDRRRRYGTPNELAADLERHLNDEPVSAAAPSLAYQLGKLYRRRRNFVRWVAAVALIVTFSAILSGGLAIRMNTLRDEAVTLRANAEIERDRAIAAEREVNQRSEELERQLYVSDMGAAERAIENEEWLAARDLLLRHRPEEGREDQRGFEWRYYWEQAQGDQLLRWQAHEEELADLEVSPDGKWLATYGLDGRVKIWNLDDQSLVHEWEGLGRDWGTVSFSADQRHLSMGSLADGGGVQIRIKDLESKQDAWIPEGHWGFAAMSPVGSRLLTLRTAGEGIPTIYAPDIRLWDYTAQSADPFWDVMASYAVWSPSAKKLAFRVPASKASNMGHSIEVWDVASRERTHRFPGQRFVRSLAFSSDERLLAAADGRGMTWVSVWDLESSSLLFETRKHENSVTEVRFHPTKPEVLASCSIDQTIRIWNCREKKVIRKLTGQGSDVTAIAFTRDGEHLVSGSKDGAVMLWQVEPSLDHNLLRRAYTIAEPVFSSSGRLLSINEWNGRAAPNRVDTYYSDFITREEARVEPSESSAEHETGERFMFDTGFRFVVLDETTPMPEKGNDEVVVIMAQDGMFHFHGYAPNGFQCIEKEESEFAVKADELRSFKEALMPFKDNPVFTDEQRIEFATRFFELDRGMPQLIWQDTIFETETTARLWNVTYPERALAFTPDESSLLTLTTNQLFFRDAMTGELQGSVEFEEAIWNRNFQARGSYRWFDLSPDGNQIAVTELKPAIRIIDTSGGETISVLDERLALHDLTFVPSGDQLLFRGYEGVCGLWNWTTGEKTLLKGEGLDQIKWIDVSPDCETLAAVCADNAIRVWRATDGSLLRTIRGLREGLSKIAFVPDGRSVAVLHSREPKVRFWNTSTWRQVAALDRISSSHDVLGFSPSGKELLLSGRGGTRIWRTPTLAEIDLNINSQRAPGVGLE